MPPAKIKLNKTLVNRCSTHTHTHAHTHAHTHTHADNRHNLYMTVLYVCMN